jgi:hypothetical protein
MLFGASTIELTRAIDTALNSECWQLHPLNVGF